MHPETFAMAGQLALMKHDVRFEGLPALNGQPGVKKVLDRNHRRGQRKSLWREFLRLGFNSIVDGMYQLLSRGLYQLYVSRLLLKHASPPSWIFYWPACPSFQGFLL